MTSVIQIGAAVIIVNARNRAVIMGEIENAIRAAASTGRCVSLAATVHCTGENCDHTRSRADGE